MNEALLRINEEYTMLHYPYFKTQDESFAEAQANLTDYCLSQLPSLKGKTVLEIGCGNGVQALYISKHYKPAHIRAIDLDSGNIEIARKEAERKGSGKVHFQVDDAHQLETVESDSVDVVINIESAFHYPDKPSFIREVHRVLKPGGMFLIADILTTSKRKYRVKEYWKQRMSYHHWPLRSYHEEIPKAELEIHSVSDITRQVIRSFRCYRQWFRDMKSRHFLEDLLMKIYYTVHVRLNIHLLKTRRQYCVIVGQKEVSYRGQ